MNRENAPANARNPITVLTVVLVITWAVLAGLGWLSYRSYREKRTTTARHLRIEELRGSIIHLNEVLTMSARMAALTGDLQWEERYRRFEPRLDIAIKEAIALAPGSHSGQGAADTDAANIKLVEMENQAFDLVRQGRAEEAKAVLFSDQYESQKQVYAEGMDRFEAGLADAVSAALQQGERLSFLQTGVVFLLMPFLIIGWVVVFRAVSNWKTTLVKHAEELAEVNQSLDKKVAERTQALREAKDYTDSVIRSMSDMLLVVSPDGRIVTVNQAACELLGYPERELIGQPASLLFQEEEDTTQLILSQHPLPVKRTVLRRLAKEGSVSNGDKSLLTKSGKKIPVLLSGAVMRDDEDEIRGIVCLAPDITERKKAEEELTAYNVALESANKASDRFREAAKAANRAKSEFLANMSHEIRTPMTAILGFTDILLNDLKEPKAIEAAQTVNRNGKHLLQIINDILDISKIEAGKVEMEMIRWSPRQVVAEVVSLLYVRADAKGLTLSGEYKGPLPETITTDPARLRQILVNLVGNAIKFTETGGVRIVTRLVEGPEEEPQLRFDVIETGIGIPEDEIKNLFEPFTQADGSSSRKFEGTGLGLAISRQLARMLGGDITARSKPGEGSTFTVTVATGPLDGVRLVEYVTEASPASKQPVESTGASQEKLRCRVLLAEDIPDNQRLISALLSEAGAEVTIAQNGQEAVEKALATCPGWGRRYSDPIEPFDVILMDIQMPVLDGYEATRRLRQEGYTGPIIALTAHAMRDDRQKCLDAGCDDYLCKPISHKKLVETVAKWVSRQPEQAEATARE